MRRPLPLIATLALLVGGVSLVAAEPPQLHPAKAAERPVIKVRGHVKGLYPGSVKRVRLKLRNRSRRPRVVTRIRARVKSPGGGCSARSLKVRPKKVRRRVPARGGARVRYRIRMVADAANACQGKRFRLRYRARVKHRSRGRR